MTAAVRCPHSPSCSGRSKVQAARPGRTTGRQFTGPVLTHCKASTRFGQSKLKLSAAEAPGEQEALKRPEKSRIQQQPPRRNSDRADKEEGDTAEPGGRNGKPGTGTWQGKSEGETQVAGSRWRPRPRRITRYPKRNKHSTNVQAVTPAELQLPPPAPPLATAPARRPLPLRPVSSPWRPPVRRRASSYVVQAKYAVGYVADCLKHPERETWRAAGVLPYMFGEDDELRVLLIKQEGGLPSSFRQLRRHGAWNLLGGKRDAKDESAEATALREMTEETGGLLNPDDVPDGFQTVVWHPLGRYAAFPYHVKGKADLPELYASWRKDGGACAGGRNTIEMRWIPLADLNEPNRRKMHVFLRSLLSRTAVMAWLHVCQLEHDAACGRLSEAAFAEAQNSLSAVAGGPLARAPHLDVPLVLRDKSSAWEQVTAMPESRKHSAAISSSLASAQAPSAAAAVEAPLGNEASSPEALPTTSGPQGASMRNNGVNAQRRQIEVATQSSTSLGACSSSEDTADGRTAASLHVGQEVERPDTHTSAQPELESPHMPDKAGREPGNKVQAADVDATGTSLVLEPDDRAEVAQDEPAGASAVAEGAVLGAAAAKPTPEVLSGEVAAALGVGAEAASMLAEDLFGLPSSRLNLPETLSEASGGAWTCWPKPTQARAGPAVPDLTAVEYLREGRAAYRQMKCALLEEYGLDSEAYRTDTGSQW